MTRLQTRLDALRSAGRKALVPFVTAGDPSLEASVPVMEALAAAGADVIELGVPFSDPMADGPVIQRSSERALARGAGLAWVLDCVRGFRAIGNFFWKICDVKIIDGLGPNGAAWVSLKSAARLGKIQSGYVYHYAFVMLLGVAGLLTFAILAWGA